MKLVYVFKQVFIILRMSGQRAARGHLQKFNLLTGINPKTIFPFFYSTALNLSEKGTSSHVMTFFALHMNLSGI